MPVPRPSTSKGQEDAVYIEMTEVPPVLPPAPPPSRNGSFRESTKRTPISPDGVPVRTLRRPKQRRTAPTVTETTAALAELHVARPDLFNGSRIDLSIHMPIRLLQCYTI